MKFIKTLLMLFWMGASLLIIYFFWTGVLPERITGSASPSGLELQLKVTGARGWNQTYQTTLVLTDPNGGQFVYCCNALGSRTALNELIGSMSWEDLNTLSFINRPQERRVTISQLDGLWDLDERTLK